ncbi:putative DNA binding protein [Geoglobus ahangari]|uniref:Putative DNA binding protein n=1 Tax=Geoglobus ahangari TaxID=113653 RepID=A0A0F7IIU7_9EURY|nr:helix-turn-helix domain-containing protein [Geoglobus ahangari]AKG92088.1 putative DNA binding protein [Geoglobus ahangari]
MMSLKKVTLRLWHPECWSIESTKDHPGVCLVTKGVFKLEKEVRANFHLIAESYDALKEYMDDIRNYDRYAKEVYIIGKSDLEADIHARFPSHATFYDKVFSLEFMPMRVSISGGYEYWTILIDEEKLSDTLNRLLEIDGIDVEVLSIANLKSFEDEEEEDVVSQISRKLSMKQKRVLIEAYRRGYFEWPRKTSVDELARSFGIAKSTCLHHLRIAESKIMKKIIEELKDKEPHLMDIKTSAKYLF